MKQEEQYNKLVMEIEALKNEKVRESEFRKNQSAVYEQMEPKPQELASQSQLFEDPYPGERVNLKGYPVRSKVRLQPGALSFADNQLSVNLIGN